MCAGIQNQTRVQRAGPMPSKPRRRRMRLSSSRWNSIIWGPKNVLVRVDRAKAQPSPEPRKAGRMWWSTRARVNPRMPTNPALMTRPSRAQARALASSWETVQGRLARRARRLAATISPSVPSRANWRAAER
ncbi:MAG TPA: hypothetical protein DHV93_10760 [Holophagaceae bacterium]|nr:hypothetical protein [Holophagaceae bacterium]